MASKLKCPTCEKEKSLHMLRIWKNDDGTHKTECLACHTGISEEMERQVVKTGDAFFAAADKIWEQILV